MPCSLSTDLKSPFKANQSAGSMLEGLSKPTSHRFWPTCSPDLLSSSKIAWGVRAAVRPRRPKTRSSYSQKLRSEALAKECKRQLCLKMFTKTTHLYSPIRYCSHRQWSGLPVSRTRIDRVSATGTRGVPRQRPPSPRVADQHLGGLEFT